MRLIGGRILAEKNIVVGITGASGGPYAVRLLDCLETAEATIHLAVSPYGQRLLAEECGIRKVDAKSILGRASDRVKVHPFADVGGPLASGSFQTDGMVICPCSSNTLGAVASGLGDNCITRAAQVTMKESRRLILVHREMPLSGIDLANMLRLQQAGAIICPANPGFYLSPRTVSDLVDFVVGRVLDLLGVPHSLHVRWEG